MSSKPLLSALRSPLGVEHQAPEAASRGRDWRDRAARRALVARLAGLNAGTLTIHDAGTTTMVGSGGPLNPGIRVLDGRFWRMTALGGTLGAGEAYILGYWDCDDLPGLVRLLLRNRSQLEALESGLARAWNAIERLWHRRRANTQAGSRRNIAAHYDLSNEFFKLWLDDDMMYSSAVFSGPEMSLPAASTAKLERICRKLELGPDDHLLEIGTGWGGFAIHAARHFGCRVTTTTISHAQACEARARIERAGLTDRVEVLEADYRDLDGTYSKLVSIEMVEAVGDEFLDGYFKCCSKLLEPGGQFLLQAITIEDHRYARALREVDYIKKFVFPGSFIPSVSRLVQSAGTRTPLRLTHLEDLGADYALTLSAWAERFEAAVPDLAAHGFDPAFARLWRFYLAYCEGGFREQAISNVQMILQNGPRPDHAPWRSSPQDCDRAAVDNTGGSGAAVGNPSEQSK